MAPDKDVAAEAAGSEQARQHFDQRRWSASGRSTDAHQSLTVGQAIAEALANLGVTKVFGIPGIHNLALWFALGEVGIDRVLVRHEQAAHYAADGFSRATGRLGVCVTTSGPGAANTAGATGEALTSGSAVLHITTSTPLALRHEDPAVRRGTVHDLPFQYRIFEPLVKAALTVDSAESAVGQLARAANAALAGWQGPCYLEVPADILAAEVSVEAVRNTDLSAGQGVDVVRSDSRADTEIPREALELLSAAVSPVIWAGYGAMGSDVSALAEHLGAPVVTTLMARSVIDSASPFAMRAPAHEPAVTDLVESADVIVAIGSDFDGQNTQQWRLKPSGAIIRVDIRTDQLRVNVEPTVGITMGSAEFISRLISATEPCSAEARRAATDRAAQVRAAVAARLREDPQDVQGAELVGSLASAVPDACAVVADMTMAGYWAAGYLPRRHARSFMYPMGWGTLGYSIPLAVGVAHATAEPVVVLSGDAGFLFNTGELATIKDRELPIVVVVFNDRAYGILAKGLTSSEAAEMHNLGTPDFVALAEAFGIQAEKATLASLDAVLSAALAARLPYLIEVENVTDPPVSIVARWPLKSRS